MRWVIAPHEYEIHHCIDRFSNEFEMRYVNAVGFLAKRDSLETVAGLIGLCGIEGTVSTEMLEKVGRFLDRRGYAVPRLSHIPHGKSPKVTQTKIEEDHEMGKWDKELYVKMRSEGKSNTEISHAMGFNGVAALRHHAIRDGVYSTLENQPRKPAPIKDSEGREPSREKLIEDLQAVLKPPVSEEASEERYPENVVDSPAEEEMSPLLKTHADAEKYITIRIPLKKLEPTTTPLVVVTDSIRHNLKRISSQLARVSDDITHLLGVEDPTEHVQQYIDRQLKGII